MASKRCVLSVISEAFCCIGVMAFVCSIFSSISASVLCTTDVFSVIFVSLFCMFCFSISVVLIFEVCCIVTSVVSVLFAESITLLISTVLSVFVSVLLLHRVVSVISLFAERITLLISTVFCVSDNLFMFSSSLLSFIFFVFSIEAVEVFVFSNTVFVSTLSKSSQNIGEMASDFCSVFVPFSV